MPLEKEIAAFNKNPREQLKVQLREFKGRPYLDLRIYWTPDGGTTWSPSKKGVTVGLALLGQLHESIGQAVQVVKELEASGQLKISAGGGPEPD